MFFPELKVEFDQQLRRAQREEKKSQAFAVGAISLEDFMRNSEEEDEQPMLSEGGASIPPPSPSAAASSQPVGTDLEPLSDIDVEMDEGSSKNTAVPPQKRDKVKVEGKGKGKAPATVEPKDPPGIPEGATLVSVLFRNVCDILLICMFRLVCPRVHSMQRFCYPFQLLRPGWPPQVLQVHLR